MFGNMQQMMQKAQEMQRRMEELQKKIGEQEVEGVAGGGLVRVTMTCKGRVNVIKVDPTLLNPSEAELLEDILKAAMNDARAKADSHMATETETMMKSMGLPPGLLGGGGLPF